ncbi:hypothetical protein VPH35_121189 [Triticum aestivum]
MEPIKPTPTLTSKICIQHEPADGGDARILRCISPLESVRLATVCRSWAATISERLATPTPHLFALEVLDDKHPRGAIFPVPVGDNEEDSQAPAIPARLPAMGRHAECFELCGASSSGNLSFVNGSLVLLVNPVTGASRSVEISASICQTGPNLCTGTEAFFITEFHRGVSLWWWCAEEWSERKLLLPEGFKIYHAIALSAYSNGALYALEFSGLVYAMDTRLPLPWGLTRLSAPSILEHNCIYFVGDLDESSFSTWGVYSMEERKVLFQRPVGGSPGKYKAARWFFPGVVMPLARQCTNLGHRTKINGL